MFSTWPFAAKKEQGEIRGLIKDLLALELGYFANQKWLLYPLQALMFSFFSCFASLAIAWAIPQKIVSKNPKTRRTNAYFNKQRHNTSSDIAIYWVCLLSFKFGRCRAQSEQYVWYVENNACWASFLQIWSAHLTPLVMWCAEAATISWHCSRVLVSVAGHVNDGKQGANLNFFTLHSSPWPHPLNSFAKLYSIQRIWLKKKEKPVCLLSSGVLKLDLKQYEPIIYFFNFKMTKWF